ncbi:MAG: hypothetical protein ACT4QA_24155 [Panacagrimonas sp.]
MNCEDFRRLLDDESDLSGHGSLADLDMHAARCPDCRLRRHLESRLRQQLRTLQVPAPSSRYADRVLAHAHRNRTTRAAGLRGRQMWLPAFATAATLLLGLSWWATHQTAPDSGLESLATGSHPAARVQPLRLVFRSPAAVSGVTIELALPQGVELAGYPGERQLSWQTDLQSGSNLLELPVLTGGAGGIVTATLNLGSERRQFSVRLQPALRSGMPADPLESSIDRVIGRLRSSLPVALT